MRKGQSEWEEAESERLTRVSKEQEVEYSYDADLNGAGPITEKRVESVKDKSAELNQEHIPYHSSVGECTACQTS